MSIRVPPDVAEEVRTNAAASRRSINREVELYIEEALARRRQQRAYPRVAEGQGVPYRPHGDEGRADDA